LCPSCHIDRYENVISSLEKSTIAALEQNILDMMNSVATEVTSFNTSGSSPMESAAPIQLTPQSKEIVSSYISEISKRLLNLIVYNIVESTAEDSETRCKYNIESVECIYGKHLAVPTKVTEAIRLGKRADKPRLLKVSVASESDKP